MWVSDGVSGRSDGLLGCTKPCLVDQARLRGAAGGVRYANQVGSLQGWEAGEKEEKGRKGSGEEKDGGVNGTAGTRSHEGQSE